MLTNKTKKSLSFYYLGSIGRLYMAIQIHNFTAGCFSFAVRRGEIGPLKITKNKHKKKEVPFFTTSYYALQKPYIFCSSAESFSVGHFRVFSF